MSASVKVMLSYDYCHFEVSKSTDENLSDKEINNMRKDVQRLADEAVRQYKIAKDRAANRTDGKYQIQNFIAQCERALKKPEGERTINEVAMLKRFSDEKWQEKMEREWDYDYEEDEEPNW